MQNLVFVAVIEGVEDLKDIEFGTVLVKDLELRLLVLVDGSLEGVSEITPKSNIWRNGGPG